MTKRLYETDSYCQQFDATVTACEKTDGGYLISLDQTAFFPEGGGQAADIGTLDGVEVLDVQESGDEIRHKTVAPLPVGKVITGQIDWRLRFARMQSHAGEHILSGVIHSMFGYNNVGFHMGDTEMTVDVDGVLTGEDIERVELACNEAVWRNVPITASYPTAEELKETDYRSKLERTEGLRLISIEGVDCCACCAPHPAASGEIGSIKILDFCPYKGGTRLTVTAGIHALRDYCSLHNANKELMRLLSAARSNVTEAVLRQSEQLRALQSENQQLSKRVALSELSPTAVGNSVYAVAENLSYDDLRHCANSLMESGAAYCILLSRNDGDGYIYALSSKEGDVRPLVSSLNAAFDGKGGGKPGYAQGKLCAADRQALISHIETLLR